MILRIVLNKQARWLRALSLKLVFVLPKWFNQVLKYIYRQRRRLYIITLFGIAYILLFALHVWPQLSTGDFNLWIKFVAIVSTILVVSLCASIFWILLFPRLRNVPDLLASAVFASAVRLTLQPHFPENDILPAAIFCVIAGSYGLIVYSPLLNKFGPKFKKRATYHIWSEASPAAIWKRMVPIQAHVADHWDNLLVDIQPDHSFPRQQIARYDFGTRALYQQRQLFTKFNEPHCAEYMYDTYVDDADRPITENTYSLDLQETAQGSAKVTVTHDMRKVPVQMAVGSWLDDTYGAEKDHLLSLDKRTPDWSLVGRLKKPNRVRNYIRSISPWSRPA